MLEKLRSGEYKIDNLQIIDESHSRLLDVGGVKLRLLGLGGAVVMHKMFDNGEGRTTIAGGQGTMWTTILQIGELIDTANRVYDPTETRVLVTHASPAREGLLNQLSVALKADFSISAGLHFRYGSSYNEFSVNPSLDHYRGKLSASKAQFNDVWETVKHEVEPAVSENEAQHKLLQLALQLVEKMPASAGGGNPFGGAQPNGQVDESAFKNMWNFNLADAAFGWLVLDVDQGRIGTEMRAQGFNFSHRGSKAQQRPQAVPSAPSNSSMQPTGSNLPTPGQQAPPMAQQQARPPPQGPAAAQQPPQQRAAPSVAPQQAAAPAPKPAAPSPGPTSALTTNGTTAPTATMPQTNGTAPTSETPKPAESPAQAKPNNIQQSPGAQDSRGIYIQGTNQFNTAEEVKAQIFAPEDAAKIVSLEKDRKGPWVALFKDAQTMQEVINKGVTKEVSDKHRGVRMVVYKSSGRGGYSAANWTARGGAAPRGGADAPRGGYQSAGGATTGSDSETNRGGRGRGGRGGFRGERGGRGRGGRGRGDAAAPAPASGDS